ncbi:phosphoenolpyruvate-protein phosphotransferase PtsI [Koleobacter methoxysyntrophicus]|uniref:phosphoenolpyruvate-protein phosphotransferase PtsI n=1 Tax=Koleobacter methoxysyntrophicus TaxID=2751313 RepID=UPI001F50C3B3|nr:phosphoenolpyruvate-protein phosphotransferase PtsI [Koleobacter methoxysyntrophicus]
MKGIAASPGIAIGHAYVLKEEEILINTQNISESEVDKEIKTFEEAVLKSKQQLERIKTRTELEMGKDKAEIFKAHIMVLEDPALIEEVKQKIRNERIKADNAVDQVIKEFVAVFEAMEDEYMKERAADVKDVGTRLLKNILNIPFQSLADIQDEVIVVARDLTPSDTAQMNKSKVMGFATDIGGRTSHSAIMARSLEIPAVVGLGNISSSTKNGDTVILDGNDGIVIINPDETTLERYLELKEQHKKLQEELAKLRELPAETLDKHRVELAANIGTPKDVKGALDNGAEGIGLYRTEFLYMDRDNLPTEDEQFEAYKAVAEAMEEKPVIIRTLDIGGDKRLPYIDFPEELNPFLGWRAIRMCLDRPEIIKTQLRAILRASSYGKLRIMYPMVSNISEVRRANAILEEAKKELEREGISFDREIEVGIMVEIPAAAVAADILAKEVDFFSIGTNDLIQYTLAVDRMNENIAHLYQPLHPAILRLIKNVIEASHTNGIWTGMCGEMAGDVNAAPILLGLGLDEFSMSAVSIPRVKKIIRSLTLKQAKKIADKALNMESPEDIEEYMKDIVNQILKTE